MLNDDMSASQPSERSDKPELCEDQIGAGAELSLLNESQSDLGFSLHVTQKASGGEMGRNRVGVAIRDEGEVSGFLRRVESTTQQVEAGTYVSGPGIDGVPEIQVDAGLESIEPTLLHQIDAELAEAESRVIIAELSIVRIMPRYT